MKKIAIYICLLLLIQPIETFGQQTVFDVTIHSRVDTTKSEVKEVAELWINYLNSQPDSIYDNPYWNNVEKAKFKSFDFSRAYLFQFPSKDLLGYFKPTILSIEKEGNNYGIRTIFSADGLQGKYRKSNPWCITKLYAIKENNEWKLKNALPIITESWKRRTIGKITFIYSSQHKFDEELAKEAVSFCDSITSEFNFNDWESFDFYITENGDEMGELLNFNFFFAGYTTGVGMNENRILLSGLGSEFYPHEFIHLILPKFDRHWMIEEGFATWKGGAMGKNFNENAQNLAQEIASNDTITFDDILNKKWGWQFAASYTTGAIFCNLAYNKGGVSLVKELLSTPNNNKILVQSICALFEIEKSDLNSLWKQEVLKYIDK